MLFGFWVVAGFVAKSNMISTLKTRMPRKRVPPWTGARAMPQAVGSSARVQTLHACGFHMFQQVPSPEFPKVWRVRHRERCRRSAWTVEVVINLQFED